MRASRDPIAVVEAAYDLSGDDADWVGGVTEAVKHVLPPGPHGVLGYHLEPSDRGYRILHPAQANGDGSALTMVKRMQTLMDSADEGRATVPGRMAAALYRRVLQGLFGQSSELLLQSELRKLGPDWMYTLGVKGVRDVFFLKCDHIDGHGTTVFATGLPATPVLTPRQRQLYLMLSAHLKAGYRLRRQLAATQQDADALEPDDGAILDAASMRVVHAEGSAQASTAQAALVEMARNIDRARAQQSGRDERAVEVWQGLVDGRWSLVERFDADGRRFVVAHKNSENVRDQLGLTQMEARVAALASRGHSNKLIAYHLGISEGTASSHLHGAMAKLRVSSRVELVRLIAHSETKAWS